MCFKKITLAVIFTDYDPHIFLTKIAILFFFPQTYLTLLFLCWTAASSLSEDTKILADYKCIGRAPSLSRNQLMVICGETVSLQNASTTSQSNLRLIMNGRENRKKPCGSSRPLFLHFDKVKGNTSWNVNFDRLNFFIKLLLNHSRHESLISTTA